MSIDIMSTQLEITRLTTARNTLRAKGVELGLCASTDKLDAVATKFDENLVNQGSVSATVKEGETYTIPQGYHNGSGTVSGVAGGGSYIANVREAPDKKLILEVAGLSSDNTSGLQLWLYVNGPSRLRKGPSNYYSRRGWRHPQNGKITTAEDHWVLTQSTRLTEFDISEDQISIDPTAGIATIKTNSLLRPFIAGFARKYFLGPDMGSTELDNTISASCLKIGRSVIGIPGSLKDSYHILKGRFGFALHEKTSKKRLTPIYPIDISVTFRRATVTLGGGAIKLPQDLYPRIL